MLMMNKELSPQQRLEKCVVDIMGADKYIALTGVLMLGEKSISDKCPTAATNGRDEVYGSKFIQELIDPELRFVILHECRHKLYRHLITWKHLHDQNHTLANMACDYVINLEIDDENKRDGFAVMPVNKKTGKQIGLLDARCRNMSTQEVFEILRQELGDDYGEGGDEPQGGDGRGKGGNGSGKEEDSDKPPNGNGDCEQGSMDEHDWDGAEDMSESEKRELEKDIDQAIRQGALTAGKMGSSSGSLLHDLLQPEVDWREVLRDFITDTCAGNDFSTYQKPNRRYMAAGYYMPSGRSTRVGELVIAVDTSGSISTRALSCFLSEIGSIVETVKPSGIRLLYWGTAIVGDELYGEGPLCKPIDTLVGSTKPRDGGGTLVECVPEYIRKKAIDAQAVIVLTDGYLGGGWGTWSHPLLWCIQGSNKMPTVGKVVKLTL